MENTKIEWASHTFNCWIGCAHATFADSDGVLHPHRGCQSCYAEADMDKRRGRVEWGPKGTRSRTSDDYWRQPLKWNHAAQMGYERHEFAVEKFQGGEYDAIEPYQRPRVFCASLADVFEDWQGKIVDAKGATLRMDPRGFISNAGFRDVTMNDIRRDLFTMIDKTPWLDWLLLTKRPQNIRRMWMDAGPAPQATGDETSVGFEPTWFRKNVWLISSVSDQESANAIVPELLKCRDLVPVLGLSAEPMLDAISLMAINVNGDSLDCLRGELCAKESGCLVVDDGPCIDWVICGSESGHGARTMREEWAKSLKDQCESAGTAFFLKQYSTPSGKKITLPMLDGRRWADMPVTSH